MNNQTDTQRTDAELVRELNEARQRLATEWSKEEVEDQWTAAIEAAHPANDGADDSQVNTALEMVSHRHRKWSLVALVNWLLLEQKKIQQQRDRDAVLLDKILVMAATGTDESLRLVIRQAGAALAKVEGKEGQ